MDLFVYGTLMVPQVMRSVSGHRGVAEPAYLPGFRRRSLRDAVYPAVIASAGDSVEGLLYRAVSAGELQRLDIFEGEQYRRMTVRVTVADGAVSAETYVLASGLAGLLSDRDWSLAHFLESGGLEQFLAGYVGFSDLAAIAAEQQTHGS